MVDVYHEFNIPYEMLAGDRKALKPNGRVVFVEYRKEDPNVPIKLLHKMTEAQVKREAGPAGIRPALGRDDRRPAVAARDRLRAAKRGGKHE